MHDPAPVECGQQLDRAGQRPPFGQDLAEDLAVPALQQDRLVIGQAAADLTGDGPREQSAAHADPAMDPPAVDRVARLEQRALPGEDVRVDGVDEGPVQVEDQRSHGGSMAGHRRPWTATSIVLPVDSKLVAEPRADDPGLVASWRADGRGLLAVASLIILAAEPAAEPTG